MIGLSKGPVPDVLSSNGPTWTAKFLRYVEAGATPPPALRFRYRHADIKAELLREAHSKCVYCESYVLHVEGGETDHVEPVSRCPARVFDWTNLVFACRRCNGYKRDFHAPGSPLVNPFVDEPGDHLCFAGFWVFSLSSRGTVTREQLRLNRDDLADRRRDRLEAVATLLREWTQMSDGAPREVIARALRAEITDEAEYAACVRSLLRSSDFPL